MLKDKKIKGYILKNVKQNVEDYEDIVQDSFLIYLEKRNAGVITKESNQYLHSIIYTVVRGRRRDYMRNVKRYVLINDIKEVDSQYNSLIKALSFSDDTIDNIYKQQLVEFIATLDNKEKKRVAAFLNEGTYANAAKLCGVTECAIADTFNKIKNKWKRYVRR